MRTYRMSSIGHCPRRLSAEQLGYEPEPAPPWLEQTAKEGKWHEQRIIRELTLGEVNIEGFEKIKWVISEPQEEQIYTKDNWQLVGHIECKLTP